MTYKRGDFSPCGTKRFWAYQAFVKRDGNRSESWVSVERYEAQRERVIHEGKVNGYRRLQLDQLISRRATA